MHGVKWGAVACALLFAVRAEAGPEVGDYSGLPKDLATAAVAYDVAQFTLNRPELERWLANDYVLVTSDGRNVDKVAAVKAATAPGGTDKTVVISQQVKRAWPNGAVLAGFVEASETVGGKRSTFRGRFADIWAKRGERWQVVFTQITKVAQ